MDLILALAVVFFFLAVIAAGRYAELAVRRKVRQAIRRNRCPQCTRRLDRARVRPVKPTGRRRGVSDPRQAFPETWRVQCRQCGRILHCDSSGGRIRFM